eukprot:scaffold1525_cov142-Cylindrotheca_fusiformis.AAC.115
MTARDYQHSRFRPPGTRDLSPERPSPRLVTPTNASSTLHTMSTTIDKRPSKSSSPVVVEPDYVHKPTQNGMVSAKSPLRPVGPQRYSLTKGAETQQEGALSKHIQNANAVSKSKDKKKNSRRKHDPNSYKIFLLLLQPESKIFELIQLIYLPNDTTIGDIIAMIPENATEHSLGNQEYSGLCRPRTQEEIVNKELLASETTSGAESAKVTLGEILVAIPKGHTGADVSKLSKQILSNPKIVKLLKRADPLAPKKRRSRKGRSRRAARSLSREKVDVLEKHDEAEEIKQEESERLMKQAMEHAAAEAAAANAEIADDDDDSAPKMTRQDSTTSDGQSLESSLQESLDESYSSWSKSFDASFSVQSSICSGISRRAVRRRDRQAKRLRIIKRSVVVAFGSMIFLYMMDPKGYSGDHVEEHSELPMGFKGLFQVVFLLLALFKIERLIRSTTNSKFSTEETKCPFLKAASGAMKRFKESYSKKLKKPTAKDGDRIKDRLRGFSLKAATFKDLDDGDTTGSL